MRGLSEIELKLIKTCISVMFCLLLAYWLKLPPPIYACTAAVIVTRETVELSFRQSIARIISTLVGCSFALVIAFLNIHNEYLHILLTGIGCSLTIYFCVLIKHPDASALAAITYLLLTLTHLDDRYDFTLRRVVETIAGILIAMCVNMLLKGKTDKRDNSRKITENN